MKSKIFEYPIREDIVAKVIETKKKQQPYSNSPVAGKQHSAKGLIVHARHVWRSGYGRGQSRVPRKIFSRRGSQFNWQGAEVPHAKGGMRAHPPKITQFVRDLKINKKELKIALFSSISATASEKYILKKYSTIKKLDKKAPFIVSSDLTKKKTKDILSELKTILGNLYPVSIKEKSVRAGKGKLRGRKYKSNAGMILIIGKNENVKTGLFDVRKANELSVSDLAKGGLGRVAVYTEEAVKELENKMEGKKK
ncbi:50S ribosomal protein L4 [Candidatus Pacearchaeota archaeon]|jgi:large subunit ribosomal protein L4e|nr:50S ribosomal protein L4 [Candidatus Pacearchaeota archaeon]HOC96900.1 50S ribosomal protein L4 [Candidatus Pacearchaeota archaeon]